RKQTFVNELLLSVQVRKDGVEQRGALDRGAFDRGPFIRFDEQRNRIHRPRVLAAVGKVPAVVRDSLRLDQLLAALPPAAEFAKTHPANFDEESSPMAARKSGRPEGFIPVALHERIFELILLRFYRHRRLKSSVAGNSGFASGGGTVIGPGVCPNSKKRAMRRASASFEFTGNVS